MLRSLYSGVSGMRNFQTKMDVIANNIANVNTTAFKSGRAKFQDLISQSVASAKAPQTGAGGRGGVNPQQIGLGVKVGSIDTIMEPGQMQPTNRGLDFAIDGEGFFTVSPDGGATKYYTRDGAFYIDKDKNLVNANGDKVLDKKGEHITGVTQDKLEELLTKISITTFANPDGLDKIGGNNYAATENSGDLVTGEAGTAGKGTIQQSFLEMSNVDLANEFTEMIVTSRAYQANSRSITTSDEMIQELLNLKR